jgi:hypothetical protein
MREPLQYLRRGATALFLAFVAAMAMQSCYEETYNGPSISDGTFDCLQPNLGHKETFGGWDPCCERSICCPNPLLDHYAEVNGSLDHRIEWDPCCKVGPCPNHNPWIPKATPAPPNMPDGGSTSDASACNDTCDGDCVPRAVPPFSGPLLLALTAIGEEPGCPAGSEPVLTNHFVDLSIPPLSCPDCACDPSAGECGLPGTITAHSGSCPGDSLGSVHTDASPPPNWNGTCTAKGAIPAGAQCNGTPCVRSLTVDPLALKDDGCAPRVSATPPPAEPPQWRTAATICQPSACSPGAGAGACVTKAGSGRFDWRLCLATSGDAASCPVQYAHKHVVYGSFTDSRECSACTCYPPSGSQCVSELSVYEGATCKGAAAIQGVTVTVKNAPLCIDLPPGIALGSKVMARPVYLPGACEPRGGNSTGEVAPEGAVTLCCLSG